MDVVAAFLYEKLQNEVSMEQPEGFLCDNTQNLVWFLTNVLYCLKHAQRKWDKVIDN